MSTHAYAVLWVARMMTVRAVRLLWFHLLTYYRSLVNASCANGKHSTSICVRAVVLRTELYSGTQCHSLQWPTEDVFIWSVETKDKCEFPLLLRFRNPPT